MDGPALLPAPLRLLLVRHAATDWTAEGRYQGRLDPPLSAAGCREAAKLADVLAVRPIRLVISSPLGRALATARPIAAATRARLCVDERLVEIAYGAWEGLTQAEVKARFPDELRSWKRTPATARPPAGESLAEARTRLEAVLADLPAQADGGEIALVTHDLLIRLALLLANGEGLERVRSIAVAPASAHPLLLRGARLAPVAAA